MQLAPNVVRPKSSTVRAMRSPLPSLPEHVLGRHHHVLEGQPCRRRAANAELFHPLFQHLEAGHVRRHQKGGDLLLLVGAARPGVRAMTVSTSAMPPLVIQRFVPLRMYALPSGVGVAVVWTLPASEPASGSVRAKAASFSPLTSGGSQRSFLLLGAEQQQGADADAVMGVDEDGRRVHNGRR